MRVTSGPPDWSASIVDTGKATRADTNNSQAEHTNRSQKRLKDNIETIKQAETIIYNIGITHRPTGNAAHFQFAKPHAYQALLERITADGHDETQKTASGDRPPFTAKVVSGDKS